VSELTVAFLEYSCAKVAALGKDVLALIWDNAGWHGSKRVRGWVKEHNRKVKHSGAGVRILLCPLPVKSPWLNPIEPHWIHGKRQVIEPKRLLSSRETEERACAYYGCQPEPHLAIAQNAA
jgi:transposase